MAQTVPLICGGVYERIDPATALPERVQVNYIKRQVGGGLVGMARQHDSAYELEFVEGDESMMGWSLVAKPMELKEPISAGSVVEHENASLKRQLKAAKSRVSELEREEARQKLTDDKLVTLVQQGTRWGEIGKPYNMGWSEVKKRFETLAGAGELDGASPAAKRAATVLRGHKNSADKAAGK